MKKLSVCLSLLLLNCSYAQSMFKGSEGGGGGDASEERVSEIRADILSWINKGGSKGLNLPEGISLNEYDQKMSELLQPKAVVVTFIAKDDPKDEELQVNVHGKPKTCRGFFSLKDARPHMICNIARFKETSPSDQYKLVHHEYAGLAYLEKNDGAASDYSISDQISDYLEEVKVLKLAVKKIASPITKGTRISLKGLKKRMENRVSRTLKNSGFIVTNPAEADMGFEIDISYALSECSRPNVYAENGTEWEICSKPHTQIKFYRPGQKRKWLSYSKHLSAEEISEIILSLL